MITKINEFKNSLNKSNRVNENAGLSLTDSFTVSNPYTETVSSIIDTMLEDAYEANEEIDSEDENLINAVLSKLTPEICQSYVDTIQEINDEYSGEAEEDRVDAQLNYRLELLVSIGILDEDHNLLV